MDRVDDLLDGEDDTQPEESDNRSFAELRKAYGRLEKQNKAAASELEELRAFKVEREQQERHQAIAATFTEIGLNPKHAKFYQGEDATPEAIKAWAVAEDFLPADGELPEPAAATSGYTPTVITDPKTLGSRNYSVSEWKELARTNPDLAQRLHAEGRVDLAGLRVGLGPDR